MKKAIMCVVLCLMLLVSNTVVTAVSAEDNYADNWVYLEMGTATYETDTTVAYTMLHFAPEETGKYTITCEEQQIGTASYNDMWVMITPSADTVNLHSIEWSCSSVGQGFIIAVESGDGAVTITVNREDLVQKEEVPWTIYENTVTPEAFTFPGDSTALKAVNTGDAVADSAVLGADGYYHLNAANGPILFAKLNDGAISLQAMLDYGQIKEVIQDENKDIVSRTDFNNAVTEYVSCMDSQTGLYPLTADLIEVYQRVGDFKGWYGTGFVGGDLEDAWMFACYYQEDLTSLGGVETEAGDVNRDGAIDLNDATAMFYFVNGLTDFDEDTLAVADYNGDGDVNLNDATAMFYLVNGLAE